MDNSSIAIESHLKGYTCLSYDEKLDYVITGGFDGYIKAWSGLTNNNVLSYKLPSGINCIVCERDRIFSASASNRIESFSIIDKNNKAVLSQFASNVNYLQINTTQTRLVACSDDFSVKLINLPTEDQPEISRDKREIIFEGHQAPVMSVSINCSSDLIASSSCDGTIIVWETGTKRILKSLSLLKQFKDISAVKNHCRLKWSPKESKILFVPLDNEIRIIDCTTWNVVGTYNWSTITSNNVSEIGFSVDGKYLAAGTSDGWIIVWDNQTRNVVFKSQNSRRSAVTGVQWYPKRPETLLFSDASGFWEAIKIDIAPEVNNTDDVDYLTAEEIEGMFDDFAEEDMIEAEKDIKETETVTSISNSIPQDDDQVSLASTVIANEDEEEGDEFDGEDTEISIMDLKSKFISPIKNEVVPQQVTTKIIHVQREPHPPVLSTSCPRSGNDQLVLWNTVAAIKKHYDDDGDSGFLEVDFQNCQTFRNLIYRHELIEYDIGDVNQFGLMLVSYPDDDESVEDSSNPARVHVRPLNASWQEWNLVLPAKEKPVGCCLAGEDYAVLLTNRFLRYFHVPTGGLQVHIECLHGIPVSIASSHCDDARQNQVIVVIDDGQKLVWRIEELSPGRWMEHGRLVGSISTNWHPLPLSQSANLTYIGFSESGTVYSVDSKQCVRRLYFNEGVFDRSSTPRWVPVLDLKLAMDKDNRNRDRYFPIGFVDGVDPMGVMVVHCHDSRYPKIVPWPHLSMVQFKLPLCTPKSEVTELEQSLFLNQLMPTFPHNADKLAQTDKQLLLKLFGSAIIQDQDSRAFNIAKLMPDSQLIQLAIRYAAKNGKHGLAERLGKLALEKDSELVKMMTERRRKEKRNNFDDGEDDDVDKENSSHTVEEESDNMSDDNVATALLRENSMENRSRMNEVLTMDAQESPFRVIKNSTTNGRGTEVLDKIGSKIIKKSPKKMSSIQFGSFVPNSSERTLKVQKRKSTKPVDSPLAKAMKK